ncbi:glycosyltransferase [Xenorhabdus sp. PB62.4]|uniref:glycosyltransferase n=1 Tax=Xenorhabdus sp. PB62.4 TaxID=1851573 RepID=UPI001656B250|nr:glycosyltransferase [Xenorhabdus sp. PB62.4]MBC8954140.1 putative lipopolysaccharide biosynthesis protein [Xenorhabdus sp. PB62.4]
MKLLHLINLQGFGGAERIFIEYLKNSSFDNEILCTSNSINKNLENELLQFNINFSNFIGSTTIKYPTFLRKLTLAKKIEKSKPNVTIVWDFIPRLSYKPKNTTLVYYDHGCSWQYENNKKTIDFFNMLNSVITVSNASKRVMELRFNPSCQINTVINRLPIEPLISSKIINYDSPITLGIASRLVGLKGIGIAILCIKALIDQSIDAKLIIAGDGEQKDDLLKLVTKLKLEKNVEFIGYQTDIAKFYSMIDIYISTPVAEAFGLSCIEAMSNGVPVIFPLLNGQPEAIKDKVCGIGITPDISADEYYQTTGLNIDFPHDIYDPINDRLTAPKLIDPVKCATAVQHIVGNYHQLSKNALEWSKQTTDYNLFIKEFENSLKILSQ